MCACVCVCVIGVRSLVQGANYIMVNDDLDILFFLNKYYKGGKIFVDSHNTIVQKILYIILYTVLYKHKLIIGFHLKNGKFTSKPYQTSH